MTVNTPEFAPRLDPFLRAQLPSLTGPMRLQAIGGGQSNPTFFVDFDNRRLVLRKKPEGDVLPSAHAVDREYRVMRALARTALPVPPTVLYHAGSEVVGTPFYVMDRVEGRVFADNALPGLAPTERRAIYLAMAETLAQLHRVDWRAAGLADFGREGPFFQRQLRRWTQQWALSKTRENPAIDQLIAWLGAHMPDDDTTTLAHGDFKLNNLMFHPTEPRVVAVLDWELSTLGHPLADFSYHCMSWHIPPGLFRGIGGLDVQALGIPTEADYIALYCERTGFATPEQLQADWNFYLAYNMFRLAAILQGIAKRVETGTASSAQAVKSAAGARPMAELAWRFAQPA